MQTPPLYTILLVDDEPMILAALRRQLRNSGYRVLSASQPSEALSILEREKVEILLSDIDMPGMSGTALVAQVRKRFPDVIRILMTGRGSMDSAMRAINDGEVHRYLLKPFDEATLLGVVREALTRLQELRRASAAALSAARIEQMRSELDREYPGLCEIELHDGVYLINTAPLDDLAEQHPGLSELLKRPLRLSESNPKALAQSAPVESAIPVT